MSDIDARFQAFNDANPHVLADLESLADGLLKAGHTRVGVKCLWETLRYSYLTTTDHPYKLCNDYTSRYARLMIERNPQLRDVIETRPLRSEKESPAPSSELEDFIEWMGLAS